MEVKQVVVVRADLKMGKGKLAAQVSHASLEAYKLALSKNPKETEEWENSGKAKVVLKVSSEKELLEIYNLAKRAKLPCSLISDAGRTQLEPGTITCLGIGPVEESFVDKITGKLKLL